MKKPSFTRLLPLVALCAAATGAQADDHSQDYAALKSVAQKLVKTLSRDIVMYSYRPAKSGAQYADPQSSEVRTWVQSGIAGFQNVDSKPGSDQFGSALYLASDPIRSKEYGSTDNRWQMLQLTIRKGAKLLDLRGKIPGGPMPTPSGEVNIDGCWTSRVYDLFYATKNKPCKIVMRRLLADLGVGVFAYDWMGVNSPFCDAKPIDNNGETVAPAFVMVDESVVDYSKSLYLTSVGPSSGTDAGSFSRSIIKAYGMNINSSVPAEWIPYPPMSATGIQAATNDQLRDYVQEKLYTCNQARYPEDRIPQ